MTCPRHPRPWFDSRCGDCRHNAEAAIERTFKIGRSPFGDWRGVPVVPEGVDFDEAVKEVAYGDDLLLRP